MKNRLYKLLVGHLSKHCYENCLRYFSSNSTILDVGIGNGIMIEDYHHLIKHKKLKITGIDINKNYLTYCDYLISAYKLRNYMEIHHETIETYEPMNKECFDFILFSMSFMLLKDQPLVLDRVKGWLKPGGEIIFFQTMYKEKLPFVEFIKPKLKYVTTVDFGKATYEEDFFILLDEKELAISEDRLIRKEIFSGEYRMIVTSVKDNHK